MRCAYFKYPLRYIYVCVYTPSICSSVDCQHLTLIRVHIKFCFLGPLEQLAGLGSWVHTEAGARRRCVACWQGHPILSTLWSPPCNTPLLCAVLLSTCPVWTEESVSSSFIIRSVLWDDLLFWEQLITIVKGMLKSDRPRFESQLTTSYKLPVSPTFNNLQNGGDQASSVVLWALKDSHVCKIAYFLAHKQQLINCRQHYILL